MGYMTADTASKASGRSRRTLYLRCPAWCTNFKLRFTPADSCLGCHRYCECCDLRVAIILVATFQILAGLALGSTAIVTFVGAVFNSISQQPAAGTQSVADKSVSAENGIVFGLVVYHGVRWVFTFVVGILGLGCSAGQERIKTYSPKVLRLSRVYLLCCWVVLLSDLNIFALSSQSYQSPLTRALSAAGFVPAPLDAYIVYLAWSFQRKLHQQQQGIFQGRTVLRSQRKPDHILNLEHVGALQLKDLDAYPGAFQYDHYGVTEPPQSQAMPTIASLAGSIRPRLSNETSRTHERSIADIGKRLATPAMSHIEVKTRILQPMQPKGLPEVVITQAPTGPLDWLLKHREMVLSLGVAQHVNGQAAGSSSGYELANKGQGYDPHFKLKLKQHDNGTDPVSGNDQSQQRPPTTSDDLEARHMRQEVYIDVANGVAQGPGIRLQGILKRDSHDSSVPSVDQTSRLNSGRFLDEESTRVLQMTDSDDDEEEDKPSLAATSYSSVVIHPSPDCIPPAVNSLFAESPPPAWREAGRQAKLNSLLWLRDDKKDHDPGLQVRTASFDSPRSTFPPAIRHNSVHAEAGYSNTNSTSITSNLEHREISLFVPTHSAQPAVNPRLADGHPQLEFVSDKTRSTLVPSGSTRSQQSTSDVNRTRSTAPSIMQARSLRRQVAAVPLDDTSHASEIPQHAAPFLQAPQKDQPEKKSVLTPTESRGWLPWLASFVAPIAKSVSRQQMSYAGPEQGHSLQLQRTQSRQEGQPRQERGIHDIESGLVQPTDQLNRHRHVVPASSFLTGNMQDGVSAPWHIKTTPHALASPSPTRDVMVDSAEQLAASHNHTQGIDARSSGHTVRSHVSRSTPPTTTPTQAPPARPAASQSEIQIASESDGDDDNRASIDHQGNLIPDHASAGTSMMLTSATGLHKSPPGRAATSNQRPPSRMRHVVRGRDVDVGTTELQSTNGATISEVSEYQLLGFTASISGASKSILSSALSWFGSRTTSWAQQQSPTFAASSVRATRHINGSPLPHVDELDSQTNAGGEFSVSHTSLNVLGDSIPDYQHMDEPDGLPPSSQASTATSRYNSVRQPTRLSEKPGSPTGSLLGLQPHEPYRCLFELRGVPVQTTSSSMKRVASATNIPAQEHIEHPIISRVSVNSLAPGRQARRAATVFTPTHPSTTIPQRTTTPPPRPTLLTAAGPYEIANQSFRVSERQASPPHSYQDVDKMDAAGVPELSSAGRRGSLGSRLDATVVVAPQLKIRKARAHATREVGASVSAQVQMSRMLARMQAEDATTQATEATELQYTSSSRRSPLPGEPERSKIHPYANLADTNTSRASHSMPGHAMPQAQGTASRDVHPAVSKLMTRPATMNGSADGSEHGGGRNVPKSGGLRAAIAKVSRSQGGRNARTDHAAHHHHHHHHHQQQQQQPGEHMARTASTGRSVAFTIPPLNLQHATDTQKAPEFLPSSLRLPGRVVFPKRSEQEAGPGSNESSNNVTPRSGSVSNFIERLPRSPRHETTAMKRTGGLHMNGVDQTSWQPGLVLHNRQMQGMTRHGSLPVERLPRQLPQHQPPNSAGVAPGNLLTRQRRDPDA